MKIIAADEVGVGCLAGDVVVVGIMVDSTTRIPPGMGTLDSKSVSAKVRDYYYDVISSIPGIQMVMSHRTAADVDAEGVHVCRANCFVEAIQHLFMFSGEDVEVLIDGASLSIVQHSIPMAKFIPKGDESDWRIGAASIIAKVIRDNTMSEIAQQYPGYGFDTNAGYGTKEHMNAIRRLGPTPYHRMTFLTRI